ncbi:uncharacterized protein [Amphiura filiformis]|uniref:uncharacterized protein n=1 Tax=Amphiura filiformis TaxID=82378 RepID=UPI003B21AF87
MDRPKRESKQPSWFTSEEMITSTTKPRANKATPAITSTDASSSSASVTTDIREIPSTSTGISALKRIRMKSDGKKKGNRQGTKGKPTTGKKWKKEKKQGTKGKPTTGNKRRKEKKVEKKFKGQGMMTRQDHMKLASAEHSQFIAGPWELENEFGHQDGPGKLKVAKDIAVCPNADIAVMSSLNVCIYSNEGLYKSHLELKQGMNPEVNPILIMSLSMLMVLSL